ncbi:MAG: hypothetical protein KC543_04310 [Myxococcales bacterium]|nr:hypothetical protein [Myxococcales bacterium]
MRVPLLLLSLALLVGAVGCTSAASTAGGDDGIRAKDAAPLPVVSRAVWDDAPAGCEGKLTDATTLGIAQGEPELVVALAGKAVVCVDTYSAVEAELEALGLDVNRLWLGYMSSLQELGGGSLGRATPAEGADAETPQPTGHPPAAESPAAPAP